MSDSSSRPEEWPPPHQQKNSCVAIRHQALQRDFCAISIPILANGPPPHVRSQFSFLLNLPHNALRLIPCHSYAYFVLCPFSTPYVS